MAKVKYLVIILLVSVVFTILPTISNAAVTSEKLVPYTNGSIDYIINGLELEEGASYQWAIEKSQNATIANWYDVVAPEYDAGTVRISVSAGDANQLEILKSTDTAYIYIRKVGEDSNILENYKVDLSLPLLKAFTVVKSKYYNRNVPNNPAFEITSVYGLNADDVQYKWEKITDASIVNNYIDNNHDLSGLNLKGKESFPSLSDTSWKSVDTIVTKDNMRVNNGNLPAEDGLYYLWLKGSSTDVKTIYGQAVLEVGEVTKINTENPGTDDDENPGTDNDENPTDNTSTTGNNNNNGSTTGKTDSKDKTTAKGPLPNTGVGIGLVASIIVIMGIGVFTYFRYKRLKGI